MPCVGTKILVVPDRTSDIIRFNQFVWNKDGGNLSVTNIYLYSKIIPPSVTPVVVTTGEQHPAWLAYTLVGPITQNNRKYIEVKFSIPKTTAPPEGEYLIRMNATHSVLGAIVGEFCIKFPNF